jgi:hypothetical protein
MNTRDLEELTSAWSEKDLATALRNFIDEAGRIPGYEELIQYLSRLS